MVDTWTNWAGNQTATGQIVHPRGTDEIAMMVSLAVETGSRVKPIGAGHSFTGIGRPDGVQIALDRHADLVSLDTASGLVTVQSGMRLKRLNRLLAEAGLGLTNLGDIDEQTVAGAMATGTHGTGARFGGMATQLRGLELILADGQVLTCSATEHPEIFGPARVNLGALGVVSALTLQTEPGFALRAEEFSMSLTEVLARFDEFTENTDHFEFNWFPHTDLTLVKRNTRMDLEADLAPLPRWRGWWDDQFLSNTVFGSMVALGRRLPVTVPPLAAIAARGLRARTYTDRSDKVFANPRRVRFVEMEYAVPRASAVEVVTAVRAAIEASPWRILIPIEVRVAAADDIALSTATGRDSAYVAVHMPIGVDHEPYFATVAQIMAEHEGRPHWGKLHQLDAEQLRKLYPDFDAFVALRDRLDPGGVFTNDYLDRVLGPVRAAGSVVNEG
jgi:L-gulono-1,4-lactone dehydrogenase